MTSGSWRHSSQTTEQQRGIAHRIDPQANATPLDRVALAGQEILECRDLAAVVGHADLNTAERQPEFVHVARQRDDSDDAVGLIDRVLDAGDDVAVLDGKKTQIACLLQRRVFAAGAEPAEAEAVVAVSPPLSQPESAKSAAGGSSAS